MEIESSFSNLQDALKTVTTSVVNLSNVVQGVSDILKKSDNENTEKKSKSKSDSDSVETHLKQLARTLRLSSWQNIKSKRGVSLNSLADKVSAGVIRGLAPMLGEFKSLKNEIKQTSAKAYKESSNDGVKGLKQRNSSINNPRYLSVFNNLAKKNPGTYSILSRTNMFPYLTNSVNVADYLASSGSRILRKNKYSPVGKAMRATGSRIMGVASGFLASPAGLLGGIALSALITTLSRLKQSTTEKLRYDAMTGTKSKLYEQTDYLNRASLVGVDRETAIQRQKEFVKYGIFNRDNMIQALSSERTLGAENVADYFQMLSRRTDSLNRYSNDLSRSFVRLSSIVNKTGISIPEFQQHISSFMDSFKGGGFNDTAVQSIMARYSPFIKTKELSSSDIAGLYNRNQTVNFDTMLTRAYFAKKGGYNFRSDNLLGMAYEMRRTEAGDLASKSEQTRAELKGVASLLGYSNFKSFSVLPDKIKAILTEQVLPSALGVDVSKLPHAEQIVDMLMQGKSITTMPEGYQREIDNAQGKNLEDIARTLDFIQQPVNHIKELMFRNVEGGKKSMVGYVESVMRKEENQQKNKESRPTEIYIYDRTEKGLDYEPSTVPGKSSTRIRRK